jgi:hypothetical protein
VSCNTELKAARDSLNLPHILFPKQQHVVFQQAVFLQSGDGLKSTLLQLDKWLKIAAEVGQDIALGREVRTAE